MNKEEYIKKIQLLEDCTDEEYKRIVASSSVIKAPASTVIINEGDLADSLFIILSGSVQVFTNGQDGTPIILARLDEGANFGEQAYLNNLIRTASVRALTDVELFKIDYAILDPIFKRSDKMMAYLKNISADHIIANLEKQSSHTGKYIQELIKVIMASTEPNKNKNFISRWVNKLLPQQKNEIIYCDKDQVLFKKNDRPDYVYLLVKGAVELLDDNGEQGIKVHENQIFGELGILQHKPRSLTAKTLSKAILIRISGEAFKKALIKDSHLLSLINSLNAIYSIPKRNVVVKQFMQKFDGIESIYSIYNFPHKSIICIKTIDQPIFIIKQQNIIPDKTITYAKGNLIKRQIELKDDTIVGLSAVGEWNELDSIIEMIFDEIKISGISQTNFVNQGNLLTLLAAKQYAKSDIICNCMSVEYDKIKTAISQGKTQLEQISKETGAGTVCGGCRSKIESILGLSPWLYAKIKMKCTYGESICSFDIKPIHCHFPSFYPGQYVSIKLEIDSLWVERTYTLTSSTDQIDAYEIMIKKYDTGIFSQWLFKHKNDELFVWLSKPSGKFTLKQSEKTILCFAGGIGITPFISFLRNIKSNHHESHLHIFYSISDESAKAIPEDINQQIASSNQIKLEIWDTKTQGYIEKNMIQEKVKTVAPEYIYICGPKNFEKMIIDELTALSFSPSRIIVEKFLPAN